MVMFGFQWEQYLRCPAVPCRASPCLRRGNKSKIALHLWTQVRSVLGEQLVPMQEKWAGEKVGSAQAHAHSHTCTGHHRQGSSYKSACRTTTKCAE